MSGEQKAALSNDLAQLQFETLAALGAAGPATAGVLSRSDVATSALDAAAASASGVGAGADPLGLGKGGGGPLRPGETGGGLGGLAQTGRGETGTGTGAKVAGPKGNASVGGTTTAGGTISDASRVVAGMRATFRQCYQKGLDQNPDASGSIRLSIKV